MKNTRTKIQLLILAVTVILSIVAFMYLPDVAAVQWNSAGATNYLPKIWAVVIPPVSSLIAIIFWNGCCGFFVAPFPLGRTRTSRKRSCSSRGDWSLKMVAGL